MGGRGGSLFLAVSIDLTGIYNVRGPVSPLITAGLTELRGNEADPESTLRRIDTMRFNHLSHEQLFVVDKDGFVLKGYDGTKHSVSFPLDEAAKWKDCVVTHPFTAALSRWPTSIVWSITAGGSMKPAQMKGDTKSAAPTKPMALASSGTCSETWVCWNSR